ncbi:branched-chain amino acid ABC transporter permease [Bradyrhizobium valentinum]|uniref:ABC transporter permease n=1 Tax=Bradyrhizobium valentinum TaxID=1518501 RepID=A0A0R3K2A4_9BRAD|nr:branched-chain amino acid ABC transporter permease [Bradyrhizobium valentinum]KRQ89824.1 hypothetical protein CP49_36560 [Bradyrhizobium valentinum]
MKYAAPTALLIALFAPLAVHSDSILAIAIYGFMAASLAVSFNLIFGFTGQLSLFHAASFGVSAYIVTILVTAFGWNFWLAVVPALAVVLILSLIVGTICFRFKLKEFYFAVVTMAFSEILRLVILNWNGITNGSLGITVVDRPSLWTPSGAVQISSGIAWYYLTLALLVIVYVVCQRILSSWIGRCLAAIRLNDQLGETLGIDVFKYKLLSFAVGSVLAGLVGAFYGFYSGFVEPHYLSISLGLDIIAMVLLGGVGSLIGPVIGAVILTALPHVIDLSAELRIGLYGSILIFVILVMPKGIVGLLGSRKNAA